MQNEKIEQTCEKGHKFFKTSDCPSCPKCEKEVIPKAPFLSKLSNPARSALEHEGIITLEKLATFTEKQILAIHGIGPASLPTLRKSLEEQNLSFKAKK